MRNCRRNGRGGCGVRAGGGGLVQFRFEASISLGFEYGLFRPLPEAVPLAR